MSAEQVAADLRAAAEVLRRDGWTQSTYRDARGCHCQAGALIAALGGDPPYGVSSLEVDRRDRYSAAQSLLARYLADAPTDWNDEPGRTAEEVIAALEAAADAVQ